MRIVTAASCGIKRDSSKVLSRQGIELKNLAKGLLGSAFNLHFRFIDSSLILAETFIDSA